MIDKGIFSVIITKDNVSDEKTRQMKTQLLTREEFKENVFKRDGGKCVCCGLTEDKNVKLDAHHIIERRLWDDGGYYLDNGVTLCDQGEAGCHFKAETTKISVETLRELAGIEAKLLPEDMYPDHIYDKWGNIVLEDGRRTKGPLFNDESVQKVLQKHPDFGSMFLEYVKYPRTYHLPWSLGKTDDDRTLKNTSIFQGKKVVVTRKMDGENFSGYRSYCHARSIDGRSHPSRDWAKNFWSQRSYEVPEGWRVCCENMYAVHSIRYENLESFLLGFSIWDDNNMCLSWDDTKLWFDLLEIPMVPVLYYGDYDEDAIKKLYDEKKDWEDHEGYVIRNAEAFHYKDFKTNVAKFVRQNHVQTVKHWMYGQRIEVNGMKSDEPEEDTGFKM